MVYLRYLLTGKKMKGVNLYLTFCTLLFLTLNMACSKNEDSPPDNGGPFKQGTLNYSAADQLTRYDFQSKSEVIVFYAGAHYRVSPDARRFIWNKNNFSNGTTLVQVHDQDRKSTREL